MCIPGSDTILGSYTSIVHGCIRVNTDRFISDKHERLSLKLKYHKDVRKHGCVVYVCVAL